MLTEFFNALWPVAVFAIALMLVIWWLALRINNLGIVDIAWSAAFAPVDGGASEGVRPARR